MSQSQTAWPREQMRNLTGNDDRVFLDRAEMIRLYKSGATGEEIRAWLQEQMNAKIRQDKA